MRVTDVLSQFYPDPDEPIWLRSFDAKGLPKGVHGYPQKIQTSINDLKNNAVIQRSLKRINEKQGIYFVVNAGGNEDADITRINAIFCEIDDKPIIEQHDILDNLSPWSPSIRIETKKSVHAYWLLSESITTDQFTQLQHGLIAFYKSDTSVKNLSRVMRVPFFNHVSFDNGYKYQRINLHTFRPDWRYSLAELQEGFPHVTAAPIVQNWNVPLGRLETLDDVKAECRSRIMAMDSWKAHGKWGSANGVCHNGQSDTALRIDLASGAITCWSECSLKQILGVFGLEIPRKDNRQFRYIPKRQQNSELYKWYQEQKRG